MLAGFDVAVLRDELAVQPRQRRRFVVIRADVEDLHRQALGVALQADFG
jgi:hypothetical protein